jgi:hypothetical protein
MKLFILQLYTRFKSAVPPFERKLQLTCAALTTAATSIAAINWPERLVFIGAISGYVAAIAGGVAIAMQFAEKITDANDTRIPAPDSNNQTPTHE